MEYLQAENGVKKVVSFLDSYDITKEDWDNMVELCKLPGKPDVMSQIPPKVIMVIWHWTIAIILAIGLCDNGKTYISIMHHKIISITIIISINNDRVLGIFLDFYDSKIALYTNVSMFCVVYNSIRKFTDIAAQKIHCSIVAFSTQHFNI